MTAANGIGGTGVTVSGRTRTITLSVRVAEGFIARAIGLIFSAPLPPLTGLVLPRTRSVHGFAMGRALDLLFIDSNQVVVEVCRLSPGRIRRNRVARTTIELEAGTAATLGIRIGDRIAFAAASSARSGSAPCARSGAQSTQPVRKVPLDGGASIVPLVTAVGLLAPVLTAVSPSVRADSPALPSAWVERFAGRAESLYRAGADQEALDAYETLLHVDPGSASIVSLRTGNIHQRNGRHWRAIDSYRRVLELDAAPEPAAQDARRKALSNLATLLDAMARRVEEAIDGPSLSPGTATLPVTRPPTAKTPRSGPSLAAPALPAIGSAAASRPSAPPAADDRPGRGGYAMPPLPDGRRPAAPDGRLGGGTAPPLPRVEYLGGQ
jgi:uncharacterized membrane protein (UPF0127 family)